MSYEILESKSLKLQNRVSEIVKCVEVHSDDESLMAAIRHYKEKGGTVMHLLGFSFAPRLRKLKSQRLYSFQKRKYYSEKGYRILPDAYINIKLIKKYWDDILRAVKSGSVVAWQHINLHGEYDFSDEKLQDSVGLETPKILELSLT